MTQERRSSLDAIFSPRSVAVVGASRSKGSIGYALLHNLIANEFTGPIYPVNPHAASIHSLRSYPSVSAIPDPVEMAVVLVPQRSVLATVEECLKKGVRGLVVISAGFAETGEAGAELERRIRDQVRAAGARMVGPNCMGVLNTDAATSLNATFAPAPATPGSIGFVSQSGALGVAILNVAAALGMGLTQFASMGNKADVSGNDLLEYWEEDDTTRVIAMYLESFGNPRRFAQIARRVGRRKPILVVKAGRTAAGARAASSHTGAIAGADVTVSAFLDQCGVQRANSIEELFDLARAFDRCPLPAGKRVAIVTNAGGPGIMATDACVNLGLTIAELGEATRRELASFLPAAASLNNPVDTIASASPADFRRTLAAVLADPAVDMALAIHVTPLLIYPGDVLDGVAAAARTAADKPVLAVMMATEESYQKIHGRRDLPPVYTFPEAAALALAKLERYAAWRRQPEEDAAPAFAVDDAAIAALLDATPDGYLPMADALRVVELCGIPTVAWRLAADVDEAEAAAAALGFPVVVKAIAPDVVHKSDAGAVAVDLRDAGEVRAAIAEIDGNLRRHDARIEGYLVQRLATDGHEVIFGISTDPRFGPLLMFGLGGKYVEVFRDVRFAVTPLSRHEAEQVVRGIRGFKLLEGVRGEDPADLDVLVETLLRLAQLADRHPRIRELDVNPFRAAADRSRALALDVRIRVASE